MFANLFLIQVNSRQSEFVFRSIFRLLKDRVLWAVNVFTLLRLLILYTPLSGFLKLTPLSLGQFLTCLLIAGVSVLWYEGVKLIKRIRQKR